MTVISSFPTATNRILIHGDNTYTFTAAETLKAGQVVCLTSTGGDFKIYPANSGDTVCPLGIVDQNATSGDTDVTVNLYGYVTKVANCDDTTAIEAGNAVKLSTADGAVVKVTPGGATEYIVGIAITDIAADGWGDLLIAPHINTIA
jgi:hypothetical protein